MIDQNDPLAEYASVEVVEEKEDFISPDPESVIRNAGNRAANSIPKGKGSAIRRVQEFVDDRLQQQGQDLPLPPYDEILTNERYWTMLDDCMKVVERYRMFGFDQNAASVDRDLMHLHGNLVYLSGVVGFLKGAVEHADSARRIRKSRTYLFAKEARDALKLSVTDTDATEMSRAEVSELDRSREHLNLCASVILNAYYAIRNFADALGQIAHRTHFQERKASHHQ